MTRFNVAADYNKKVLDDYKDWWSKEIKIGGDHTLWTKCPFAELFLGFVTANLQQKLSLSMRTFENRKE